MVKCKETNGGGKLRTSHNHYLSSGIAKRGKAKLLLEMLRVRRCQRVISKLNMVRLNVTMDDVVFVEEVDGAEDLREEVRCLRLRKAIQLIDHVEQFTTTHPRELIKRKFLKGKDRRFIEKGGETEKDRKEVREWTRRGSGGSTFP